MPGDVTVPRQVLPGVTYLVTRRCSQRQFLLRPGRRVNEAFLYILALAAGRFGVRIHAFCVLSNHYHLVVTDPRALLPAFLQLLDGLVARVLNALLGREEHFWSPSSYSAVALGSWHDVVDKVAYTLANPVAARLVRRGLQWPGLWSSPDSFGTTLRARRPEAFFDPDGFLPEELDLQLTAPPGFPSVAAFRDQVTAALAALEAEQVRAPGGFLGVIAVLSQQPTSRPRSEKAPRGIKPRVASKDRWRREEMLRRLGAFVSSYRDALAAWCQGDRLVVFPPGTYLMRVVHGVACAGAG
jgi:REP element-mobilizing transposase RayT